MPAELGPWLASLWAHRSAGERPAKEMSRFSGRPSPYFLKEAFQASSTSFREEQSRRLVYGPGDGEGVINLCFSSCLARQKGCQVAWKSGNMTAIAAWAALCTGLAVHVSAFASVSSFFTVQHLRPPSRYPAAAVLLQGGGLQGSLFQQNSSSGEADEEHSDLSEGKSVDFADEGAPIVNIMSAAAAAAARLQQICCTGVLCRNDTLATGVRYPIDLLPRPWRTTHIFAPPA